MRSGSFKNVSNYTYVNGNCRIKLFFFFNLFIYNIYRTNTYTTYNTNIILTYIYIALLILTVFMQASRTNTYTTYNTSIIIFFINLFVFLLTLFTLEYLRYLQNNIFTTVLTNMILKLLTKQFLHYLQCSDYTTTDKVTAPIFVILLSLKYTADQNI